MFGLWFWILLIIAAILALFLAVPIGIRLSYLETFSATALLGPLKIPLYPRPEKKKSQKKKEKKKDNNKANKKEWKVKPNAVKELLKQLFPCLKSLLRHFRKAIHVRSFSLHLVISDENPAHAAQRYGKINAAAWPLLAAVDQTVRVDHQDVHIDLDYAEKKTRIWGELTVTVSVAVLVVIFFSDILKMIPPIIKFIKCSRQPVGTEPADEKNNKEEAKAA